MDRILIRRGLAVPTAADLAADELSYRTGAKQLYIGSADGPVLLASAAAVTGSYPYLHLLGVYSAPQVQVGTLFEGSDGGLYYKNKNGVTLALAVPPEANEA